MRLTFRLSAVSSVLLRKLPFPNLAWMSSAKNKRNKHSNSETTSWREDFRFIITRNWKKSSKLEWNSEAERNENSNFVKFRLSEKHTKLEKNLPHSFDKSADLLSNRQNHEEDLFKLCVHHCPYLILYVKSQNWLELMSYSVTSLIKLRWQGLTVDRFLLKNQF